MWADARSYGLALHTGLPLELVASDGRALTLDVERWLRDADEADWTVLDRCTSPVLDVGCGPGRIVRACSACGMAALGIDIAAEAVAFCNARGGPALRCDILADRSGSVAGEGRWSTVLLLDGNIGIGGNVRHLLARVARLMHVDGRLIAEASPAADGERALRVRFRRNGRTEGPSFGWSVIGAAALCEAAAMVGLVSVDRWSNGSRQFLSFSHAGLHRPARLSGG
jgi:Methionine biosynthesis protein MetW